MIVIIILALAFILTIIFLFVLMKAASISEVACGYKEQLDQSNNV